MVWFRHRDLVLGDGSVGGRWPHWLMLQVSSTPDGAMIPPFHAAGPGHPQAHSCNAFNNSHLLLVLPACSTIAEAAGRSSPRALLAQRHTAELRRPRRGTAEGAMGAMRETGIQGDATPRRRRHGQGGAAALTSGRAAGRGAAACSRPPPLPARAGPAGGTRGRGAGLPREATRPAPSGGECGAASPAPSSGALCPRGAAAVLRPAPPPCAGAGVAARPGMLRQRGPRGPREAGAGRAGRPQRSAPGPLNVTGEPPAVPGLGGSPARRARRRERHGAGSAVLGLCWDPVCGQTHLRVPWEQLLRAPAAEGL